MEAVRAFLILIGLGFAGAGLVLSWTFDRLVGLATLVVGAFLLVLPFTVGRPDE